MRIVLTSCKHEIITECQVDEISPHLSLRYFEQIARMYDEEHLTKLKVAQRLQRLADDKLGEND